MKPTGRLFLALTLVTLLAACGSATGTLGPVPSAAPTPAPSVEPGDPDITPAPSITPTPSSDPSTSPPPSPTTGPSASPEGTRIVRAYFYLGGEPDTAGLVAVLREVPTTRAVATAAMNALLDGPSAAEIGDRTITTAVPAGTRLLGLSIDSGIATVDLSSEFETGGGSASVITRLGQVVYTLTQFPTVTSVRFQIEGQTVTVFSSEGVVLDGPVARDDYEDLLPAIWVDRPAYRAAIGNPARVAGSSNVFEATSRITLLDENGLIVVDQMVTATCGTGCRGTFDVTLRYDVDEAQWGTLRVWAGSAKDGTPIHVREYPVWLTPAD